MATGEFKLDFRFEFDAVYSSIDDGTWNMEHGSNLGWFDLELNLCMLKLSVSMLACCYIYISLLLFDLI